MRCCKDLIGQKFRYIASYKKRTNTDDKMLKVKIPIIYFIIAWRPFESLLGFSKFEQTNPNVSFLITSLALFTCSVVAEIKEITKVLNLGYMIILLK